MVYGELSEDLINEYRRVAYYYYRIGLTQEEIAKRMNMSRQRVNRIVSSCIKLGIVKITIDGMENCYLELENQLEKKFHLKEVCIIENENPDDLYDNLGAEAAQCLMRHVKNNSIIGIARGRAVSSLIENLPIVQNKENITVTQLIGNIKEDNSQLGVDNMVYELASKLHAHEEHLYAPIIVGTAELKNAFMEDKVCKNTYSIIKNSDIAIVGIGAAKKQWKYLMSLYSQEDVRQRRWAKKVVGEVCTYFYDENGNEVEPPFRDRIITVSHNDYKSIPIRIGVAGGVEKLDAIRGAVLGGYINVLVTDKKVAEKLLENYFGTENAILKCRIDYKVV